MKKLLFFLLVAMLFCLPAYAMQCKTAQVGQSEECWSQVKIDDGYIKLVSRGHVLVVSYLASGVSAIDGHLARHPNASSDVVVGIAQRDIASGESALVMTKGLGVARTRANVTSGDALVLDGISAASIDGATRTPGYLTQQDRSTSRSSIATSLETQTSNDDTNTVYIHID